MSRRTLNPLGEIQLRRMRRRRPVVLGERANGVVSVLATAGHEHHFAGRASAAKHLRAWWAARPQWFRRRKQEDG